MNRVIWIVAFAAPLAWFSDLVRAWVPPTHPVSSASVSSAITIGSITITVLCGCIAALYLRGQTIWESRTRYVARAALAISILSLLLVIGGS